MNNASNKRKLILPAAAFVTALVCLFFTSCDWSLSYGELVRSDGLLFALNKNGRKCFVGDYECDDIEGDLEIVIPDEFKGHKVTCLGGYYGRGVPTPFSIIYVGKAADEVYGPDWAEKLDAYIGGSAESGNERENRLMFGTVDRDVISEYGLADCVKELKFTLKIGKNLSEIKNVSMNEYSYVKGEDGTETVYHTVVYVECSEENKTFYSENGILYYKNGDPVFEFVYPDMP